MLDSFIQVWICYFLSRGRRAKSDEYGKLVWKMRQHMSTSFVFIFHAISGVFWLLTPGYQTHFGTNSKGLLIKCVAVHRNYVVLTLFFGENWMNQRRKTCVRAKVQKKGSFMNEVDILGDSVTHFTLHSVWKFRTRKKMPLRSFAQWQTHSNSTTGTLNFSLVVSFHLMRSHGYVYTIPTYQYTILRSGHESHVG